MQIPKPHPREKGVPLEPLPVLSATTGDPMPARVGVELLPLVDPEILEELEEQMNGSAVAVRFARDYASMWDQRYTRLAAAVEREDRDSALDAVISLRITSAMVGGVRLARLAEVLEQVIRQGDFGEGQALMARVAEHGDRTVSELQDNYIQKNA